jgi:hypothetical protein
MFALSTSHLARAVAPNIINFPHSLKKFMAPPPSLHSFHVYT